MVDIPDDEEQEESKPSTAIEGKPLVSFAVAMIAFSILGLLCLVTLHGDALYIALLIVGALALKTWLARVKSRLE